jgi:hypothetical protein
MHAWHKLRIVRVSFVLYCMWLLAPLPSAIRVKLTKPTAEAFDSYVRASEARLDKDIQRGDFLWVDRAADRKRSVLGGTTLAEPWTGSGDTAVPDGLVHDWIGAVFIPGATLGKTLALVQNYNNHKNIYKPEVIDSKILSHEGNDFKIFLRLVKKQILTVTLNTNHDVRYFPMDGGRCHSRSFATRIAEVEDAGRPDEKELPPGDDHGFLWRLNSYWRFQERDGGVYVECEAISLSRDVPAALAWLIKPIIRTLPRDSLANTMRATRDAAMAGLR